MIALKAQVAVMFRELRSAAECEYESQLFARHSIAKVATRDRMATPAMKDATRRRVAALHAKRIAAGMCRACGSAVREVPGEPRRTNCRACRDRVNARERARRAT